MSFIHQRQLGIKPWPKKELLGAGGASVKLTDRELLEMEKKIKLEENSPAVQAIVAAKTKTEEMGDLYDEVLKEFEGWIKSRRKQLVADIHREPHLALEFQRDFEVEKQLKTDLIESARDNLQRTRETYVALADEEAITSGRLERYKHNFLLRFYLRLLF